MARQWWREPDLSNLNDGINPEGCSAARMWRVACNQLVAPHYSAAWQRVVALAPSHAWHTLRNCSAYQAGVWARLLQSGIDDVTHSAAFKLAIVLRHTPSHLVVKLLADLLCTHPQNRELLAYIVALLTDDEPINCHSCGGGSDGSYETETERDSNSASEEDGGSCKSEGDGDSDVNAEGNESEEDNTEDQDVEDNDNSWITIEEDVNTDDGDGNSTEGDDDGEGEDIAEEIEMRDVNSPAQAIDEDSEEQNPEGDGERDTNESSDDSSSEEEEETERRADDDVNYENSQNNSPSNNSPHASNSASNNSPNARNSASNNSPNAINSNASASNDHNSQNASNNSPNDVNNDGAASNDNNSARSNSVSNNNANPSDNEESDSDSDSSEESDSDSSDSDSDDSSDNEANVNVHNNINNNNQRQDDRVNYLHMNGDVLIHNGIDGDLHENRNIDENIHQNGNFDEDMNQNRNIDEDMNQNRDIDEDMNQNRDIDENNEVEVLHNGDNEHNGDIGRDIDEDVIQNNQNREINLMEQDGQIDGNEVDEFDVYRDDGESDRDRHSMHGEPHHERRHHHDDLEPDNGVTSTTSPNAVVCSSGPSSMTSGSVSGSVHNPEESPSHSRPQPPQAQEYQEPDSFSMPDILEQIQNNPPAPLRDLLLFGDCEMSILAASREEYDAHATLVRQEYAAMPADHYQVARISVLSSLLEEQQIFQTPEFQQFEAAARHNIEREINTLREHLLTRNTQ